MAIVTIKLLRSILRKEFRFAYDCLCSFVAARKRTKITAGMTESYWQPYFKNTRRLGVESRAISTPDRHFSAEVYERARGPLTSPDLDLTPEVSDTLTAREFA